MKTIFQNKGLQVSFFLLLAAALIFWQYTALDVSQVSEIKESFSLTQWHYIFFAIVIGFLSHLFRALRWQLMINHIGHRTTLSVITSSVLMGYLTNLLIPRLGEVLRCTTLMKYNDVPIEKSLGTVVSERIFDVLTLFVLFFLVIILEYNQVSSYAHNLLDGFQSKINFQNQWWWLIIALICVISGVVIFRFLYKKILRSKVGNFIQSFLHGIQSIITLKKRGLFLLYTILIWAMYILMVYVALQAIPFTEHLSFSVSMVLTAFGSIAVILTPGGIGAYPPIIAGLLSIYHVQYSYGLSAGWVSWLMQTITVLILGVVVLIYLPIFKSKNLKDA